MTDNNHPITPPPELVQQWLGEYFGTTITGEISDVEQVLANRAARWGADQELEACCELLKQKGVPAWSLLRLHRRPKPPSLKEQALAALNEAVYMADDIPPEGISTDQADTIRRALESLPDNQ